MIVKSYSAAPADDPQRVAPDFSALIRTLQEMQGMPHLLGAFTVIAGDAATVLTQQAATIAHLRSALQTYEGRADADAVAHNEGAIELGRQMAAAAYARGRADQRQEDKATLTAHAERQKEDTRFITSNPERRSALIESANDLIELAEKLR
jgi:hypothetical protein